MSARIRFHIHDLVGAVSDAILDLVGELFGRYLLRVKEDFAIAHNCHNERIFPVGILHRNRIERLRQVDGHAFLQHGRDHMKMMSSTSITSTIGVTLMLELTLEPSSRTAIAIMCSCAGYRLT